MTLRSLNANIFTDWVSVSCLRYGGVIDGEISAYIVVGEEKHTGTQDAARGASRLRLATGVREWLHRWGYPWSERDGIIAVDALTHASE